MAAVDYMPAVAISQQICIGAGRKFIEHREQVEASTNTGGPYFTAATDVEPRFGNAIGE